MSDVPEHWIVMFAKAPVPGKVKTRLAVHIGHEDAARCHAAFITDMFDIMQKTQHGERPIRLCLAVSGDTEHDAFVSLKAAGVHVIPQGEGDLGDRLTTVSQICFEQGCRYLIITGSDSPTILPTHYIQAFEHLEQSSQVVVFGPSFDGGYYMVGLNRATPEVFTNIPWSQPTTLTVSMKRAQQLPACLCVLLEFWYDVDTLSDLQFLNTHLRYLRQDKVLSKSFARTCALLTEFDRADVWNRVT